MQKEQEQKETDNLNLPTHYIGVGASAGGLEAIESFFEKIPVGSTLAFIVIQHLSPDYKSMMLELLSKRTTIPILRAEEGMNVEKNKIYLIPPKQNLIIFHGKLYLKEQPSNPRGINLPIDVFFQSLAEDQGERSVGIVLSGTGSDGMRGIRNIKEAGGMIMVQSEESAKFDGMPRSAISTGLADFILKPDEMPDQLLSYCKHPFTTKLSRSNTLNSDDDLLNRIFSLVREQTKTDFRFYKPSTVLRRIERRMLINQFKDIREYVSYLEMNPVEVGILNQEMLIGVTNFFRDKDAFELLENQYIPELMQNLPGNEMRLWSAGCSTGEEAYTLAIICKEVMSRLKLKFPVKIFATDIDQKALQKAGTGLFPESIFADISPYYLSKYFNKKDEFFQVVPAIREMVVFATHNLIKDPPFTNIDFISCRNLLIYFQSILQNKALEYFNFSLRKDGILFLGSSESTGDMVDYFSPLNQKFKIYQSKGRKKQTPIGEGRIGKFVFDKTAINTQNQGTRNNNNTIQENDVFERFLHSIRGEYLPLTVIVNSQHEILHIFGETGKFFSLPIGKMVNDITKMANKDFAIPLATGLQKAFRHKEETKFTNIRFKYNEEIMTASLHIKLIDQKKGQDALAMVLIKESHQTEESLQKDISGYDVGEDAKQRIVDLEQELQFTKENLQATVEELETSNEELQATNEELLSSNEELQSTNEELQSVNEELHTVNAENQSKILELTELNNDLDNLIGLTNIAILFLDENLEVRRFTKKVSEIFNIITADIGRPFQYFHHDLENVDIFHLIENVKTTSEKYESEVKTKKGKYYAMHILPYQIGSNQFSGVLVNFIDITEIKTASIELKAKNDLYKLAQEKTKFGQWDYDIINKKIYVSENMETLYGLNHGTFPDTFEDAIKTAHPDDRDLVLKSIQEAIENKTSYNIIHRIIHSDGFIRWMTVKGEVLLDERNIPNRMIGIIQDVTSQMEIERHSSILSKILERSMWMVFITDKEGKIEFANPNFVKQYGLTIQELKGSNPRIWKSGKHSTEVYTNLWNEIIEGNEWRGEFINRRKDNSLFRVKSNIIPIKSENQKITHFLCMQEFIEEYREN